VIEAEDTASLWKRLAPYTHEQIQSDAIRTEPYIPASLVNKIEIKAPLREHLRGISCLDLPGIFDTNKERESKAKRLLWKCVIIVLVAEISRICNDAFVQDFLLENITERPEQRIIVVASKCDIDIDVECRLHTDFSADELEELAWLARERKLID
jgi:hypothetical protein